MVALTICPLLLMLRLTKKADYGLMALKYLAEQTAAQRAGSSPTHPAQSAKEIADAYHIPSQLLAKILQTLARAGLLVSHAGTNGGYALARPANKISLGSIIRAVDGPLAEVRGIRPDQMTYDGAAKHLPDIWVAARASLRRVLDETTLAQALEGNLPRHVQRMIDSPDAWLPR